MKRILSLASAMSILLFSTTPAFAQQRQTIYTAPFPTAVRVAIREARPDGEPDPRGRIIYVKTVGFDQYCFNSLPNEWVPSWRQESLQAGAMAVKMFAWYHVLNPVTIEGWDFDVDNTTNFQTYREGNQFDDTNQAHLRIRNLAYVEPDGTINELNYRAGYEGGPNWEYRNAQLMSQWGSKYWADQGYNMLQILQWYYQNRQLQTIPNI